MVGSYPVAAVVAPELKGSRHRNHAAGGQTAAWLGMRDEGPEVLAICLHQMG